MRSGSRPVRTRMLALAIIGLGGGVLPACASGHPPAPARGSPDRPAAAPAVPAAAASRPATPPSLVPGTTVVTPEPWQPAPREGDPQWLAWHRAIVSTLAASRPGLLFVGDSITMAWATTGSTSWSAFARWRPADIGLAGDTTQNVLWRIDHGELQGISPTLTVLMIGTNDLGTDPSPAVARGIEAVATAIRTDLPGSRLLVLGVLPIDPVGSARHPQPMAVNRLLAAHAFGPGSRFLDLRSSFSDGHDHLYPDLYHRVCLTGTAFCDDLVHPSGRGYQVMTEAVLPLVRQLAG